jgi:hypothetical protein
MLLCVFLHVPYSPKDVYILKKKIIYFNSKKNHNVILQTTLSFNQSKSFGEVLQIFINSYNLFLHF